MGMRSKNFTGDQTLQHSGTAEMSEPLSVRRQQPEKQSESLNCPRCSSTNTKFCYYNNYNKAQPRHFCKSCKRHWTKGGTLRNVPVGGGRKNKRPKISRAAGVAATSAAKVPATASALRQQDLLSGGPSSPVLHETSEGVDNVTISGKPFVGDGDWAGLDTMAFQIIPNKEFQLSSLSTFDMDGSLNPASCNQPCDNFAGNLDSVEESAITAVNIPGSGDVAWAGLESSSTLELPNYWNWNLNDIDVLISSDVSISWDDQDQDNAVTKR